MIISNNYTVVAYSTIDKHGDSAYSQI